MTYIKVDGHDGLIRDPQTNSIINTKMSEYQEYVSRKKVKEEEHQKLQNLESHTIWR